MKTQCQGVSSQGQRQRCCLCPWPHRHLCDAQMTVGLGLVRCIEAFLLWSPAYLYRVECRVILIF
jgi:hypothetical protein